MFDYRNTLNLPSTQFPMRGNLNKREPNILQHWYTQDLYGIIRLAKKGKKTFLLHDGPPYANGNIHIGHAINKILKDILIKSKGFMDYDSPYIPGWDCHGLPIELQVEQIITKLNNKVTNEEFRNACRDYAKKQIEKQKKDFIRLGILADWQNSYSTMNFTTEANIIRTLGKIISNNHIYRSNKPVYWCLNCLSALAEAEIEYYDQESLSIDVKFIAVDKDIIAKKFNLNSSITKIAIIIWTTTPWTLPANRAIAIHPDYSYRLIGVNGEGYIIADSLVEIVMKRIGITNWDTFNCVQGKTLELLRFHHPFMEYTVPIILGKHVTMKLGTGAVHIAPAHGPDDFILSKEYTLEVINQVSPNGCYVSGIMPVLDGVQVFEANKIIINLLDHCRNLLHMDKTIHSYPHCWRHKSPIIFRATPQWFISMDKEGLRQKLLTRINEVKWIPHNFQKHIKNMILNHPDWCISRQRTWGVPIPLFIHHHTKMLHPNTLQIIEMVARQVELHGIQAWWDIDPTKILGTDSEYYYKVTDILDVWFDSGSSHDSIYTVSPNNKIDIYLEGADQHRGWFMSSLIISTAINNTAPYRQVLTHGFALDKQGHKMSKSVGNVLNQKQIIEKFGADILRFWVASNNYHDGDIIVSNETLDRSVDSYRRIRNTARFLLANLNDFDPLHHLIHPKDMILLDQMAVYKTKTIQEKIITAYDNYRFYSVVKYIMHFCSIEMGSFYLDIIKDRQYTTKINSIARRSCQTAMYHIIEALVRWIAPIMSFTADEIWKFIPGNRAKFVFTELWYQHLFPIESIQIINNDYWQILLNIRNETNKIIEQARVNKIIGSSLEAYVILYADGILAKQLHKIDGELHFLLLTSKAHVADLHDADKNAIQCEGFKGLKISLFKLKTAKCIRCWHYESNIGNNPYHPKICERCISNIEGPGEQRKFI